MADLVNFVLRSAGCDLEVTHEDIEDPDNCAGKLGDLQEEFQAVCCPPRTTRLLADYSIAKSVRVSHHCKGQRYRRIQRLVDRLLLHPDQSHSHEPSPFQQHRTYRKHPSMAQHHVSSPEQTLQTHCHRRLPGRYHRPLRNWQRARRRGLQSFAPCRDAEEEQERKQDTSQ